MKRTQTRLALAALLTLAGVVAAAAPSAPAAGPAPAASAPSATVAGPWWQSADLMELRLRTCAAQRQLWQACATVPVDPAAVAVASEEVQRLLGELRQRVDSERAQVQSAGLCAGTGPCATAGSCPGPGLGCGCGYGCGRGSAAAGGPGYGRGRGMRGACRLAPN